MSDGETREPLTTTPAAVAAAAPSTSAAGRADAKAHVKCEEHLRWATDKSPIVKFMQKSMASIGSPFPSANFLCAPCAVPASGHYSPQQNTITICENHLQSKEATARTMTHEMIHAYDNARAELDWHNCLHQACTEIRANNLSGECHWWARDFMSLKWFQLKGAHQECIKERVKMSLRENPACKGKINKSINQVWDSCFHETAPFDEIP